MRSDVCLILEGTYPYVAGGVSTWVAQILESMPHIQFSVVYIGPKRDMPRELKYKIPANVREIRDVFVHDYPHIKPHKANDKYLTTAEWTLAFELMQNMFQGNPVSINKLLPALASFPSPQTFFQSFGHSRQAWEKVLEMYRLSGRDDISFLNFFWTHRFINLPALNLLRTRLPQARIYHSACTGYAGLLACKAHVLTGAPFILSEHGIYTRERRIEIFNAEWIKDAADASASLDLRRRQNFFKEWWVKFFLSLSRTAYQYTDHILALFSANRNDQIKEGAPPEIVEIIPNGINIKQYQNLKSRNRKAGEPFNIGFIGRVSEIKDVKTFLRALEILKGRNIAFETFIMGPLEEEKDYARECQELSTSLEISAAVHFTGRVNIKEYLERLDVVVLTSISEGLPFVILEANSAGIPIVATDVGACRELLYGLSSADRKLGHSGIITQVGSPVATAAALERLAHSPGLSRQLGANGRERVKRFYDIRDVMDRYQAIYESHLFSGAQRSIHKAGDV